MLKRTFGRSGITVSALGLGCWAIGGPNWRGEKPVGWSEVDDNASIRAIHEAIDLGVTLFDTADAYGSGHSERVLGRALNDKRDQVTVATKFGEVFDENRKQVTGKDGSPNHIRRACEASLKRLGVDSIDLYQFHIPDYDLAYADDVRRTLEELVQEGKIKYYGWSTGDPERAAFFAQGQNCTAIQHPLNIFQGDPATLRVCEDNHLASVVRSPLAMGILTGKFNPDTTFPEDDVRHGWDFRSGKHADRLQVLALVREVLASEGRSLAQGALAWLWAKSPNNIPIPGFKTVEQVRENAAAMQSGPLSNEQLRQLDEILEVA